MLPHQHNTFEMYLKTQSYPRLSSIILYYGTASALMHANYENTIMEMVILHSSTALLLLGLLPVDLGAIFLFFAEGDSLDEFITNFSEHLFNSLSCFCRYEVGGKPDGLDEHADL